MDNELTTNLQNVVENHRKERKNSRRASITMLLMVGANILTPESIAKPVIDAANQDEASKDAFADMAITMGKADPSSRVALIKAIAVQYLEQRELMELSQDLNDVNTEVLAYCAEHDEARKPQAEAMEEFLAFITSSH